MSPGDEPHRRNDRTFILQLERPCALYEDAMGRQPIDIDFTLRRAFGKQSFRPLQREVIQAVIEGHDVFLQAATSFGKSLCFQLPAIVAPGVTVVISPLLSLMVDQCTALEAKGIPVATINSTTPPAKRRTILADLLSGHPRTRLLYVTPEFCQTDFFRRHLQVIHTQRELKRIAIDEAHCVSEWGHDFRPAYKALSWLRRELRDPVIPITALTATATARVRKDIIDLLGLDSATLKQFCTPSARPNIHYEVRYLSDWAYDPEVPETSQVTDVLNWLKAIHERRVARLSQNDDYASREAYSARKSNLTSLPPMSGIIYVPLRSICSQLAHHLSVSTNVNIKAVAYHGGLSASERAKVQAEWASSHKTLPSSSQATISQRGRVNNEEEKRETPWFFIVVATTAFGMGIDNPHVRFVIHWTPPRTFEGFVQESGRAGRDGRAAVSLVYYNPQERQRVLERICQNQDGVFDRTRSNTMSRNRSVGHTSDTDISGRTRNQMALVDSFGKVIKYCETTDRCRHDMIRESSGDLEAVDEQQEPSSGLTREHGQEAQTTGPAPSTPLCDFACDFCKEGQVALTRRKELMAPESMPDDGDYGGDMLPYRVTNLADMACFQTVAQLYRTEQ